MSKIGKKIPCRSCLTEAILVIGKKIVRFKTFDEVGVEQSFENLGNSRSESNRAIVGGVGAVTLLRYRLNKCMLPRRRISAGNKNEAKKTTKNRRQFLSKFLQESGMILQIMIVKSYFWAITRNCAEFMKTLQIRKLFEIYNCIWFRLLLHGSLLFTC